jgi:precorrin-3B synthase
METADGWLLRVQRPGGAVTPAQLDVLADVSEHDGNGIIEITARANVQLRGVAASAVDGAARALVDAGLALPDPALDARRAVVAPPLTGHDPVEAKAAAALTDAVATALVAAPLPAPLAPKFGVVIDTGGTVRIGAVPGDLLVVATGDGWSAAIGPGPVRRWSGHLGADDGAVVTLAVALATWCAAHQCRAAELLDEALAAVVAGHDPAPLPCPATTSPAAGAGTWAHVDRARANVVGAPVLGRLAPPQLRHLAAAGRRGLGVRFTPTGGVAVVGVRRDELDTVEADLRAAGCSTDPSDPRHLVSACVGASGCDAGRADTRAAALALMARRPMGRVHLSGCEKRCGAPADADVLVAGEEGWPA